MFLRLLANAAAVFVATLLIPGIHLSTTGGVGETVLTVLIVAAIFGIVNSLVKPIVSLLSLPLIVLTLGLFLLIINLLMFMLTGWISQQVGLSFAVDGWLAAFLGSIVVSIVSALVGGVIGADRK